jgi:hypothetical protein
MTGQSNETLEAQELSARPEIRELVVASTEFQRWKDDLPTLDIDGERFFLPWGDIPMDSDQIVYHWARSHGLLDGTQSSDDRGPVGSPGRRPPMQ